MFRLIKVFWDICILKAPPQSVPRSSFLQAATLAAYVAVNGVLASMELTLWKGLVAAGLDAFLLVALAQTVLWVREMPERVNQTITALAGTSTILSLIALPIMVALKGDGDPTAWQALAWILLVLWSVIVVGHIMRHAMSVHFLWGMAVSAGYWYISFNILQILFLQAA